MTLVTIEAAGLGFVAVAGVGIDRGDHPVPGDAPHDTEHSVLAFLDVLAQHGRQQFAGLVHDRVEDPTVEYFETSEPVTGHHIDQRGAGLGVIPIDLRFRVRPVEITADDRCTKFGFETAVRVAEQSPDSGTDQRDRVHCRHRVIQRSGVQHPTLRNQAGRFRCFEHRFEDPLRPIRACQPGAHVHQDRVREPREVHVEPARRVLPAHIELETLDRFPIRFAIQLLEHHHRGQHLRWHRAAAPHRVQVREQLVRKDPVTLAVHQTPDRVRLHPISDHARRAT